MIKCEVCFKPKYRLFFFMKIVTLRLFVSVLAILRGLPFIFRDLAILVLQSANWQLYRKA